MYPYIRVMTRDAAYTYTRSRAEPPGHDREQQARTFRKSRYEYEESKSSKKTGHVQWWISLSRGPPAHTRRVPISVWYNTLTPKKQTRVPLSSVTAAPADSTPAHSQRKKIRKRT